MGIRCDVVPVPVKHHGRVTSTKVGLSELYLHAKPIFMNKWKHKIV